MIRQLKVYTASKTEHAQFWIELRGKWPEVHFTARWPFMTGRVSETAYNAFQFWQDDLDDIRTSDVVMVLGKPGEHLRGALVEAGMGIALGKTILVVGEHEDYGSWQYHPLVKRTTDIDTAVMKLHSWAIALRDERPLA